MTVQSTGALMTISEFQAWAKLSRTSIYRELARGALIAVKVRSRTFIRLEAAQAWLDAQPTYGEGGR